MVTPVTDTATAPVLVTVTGCEVLLVKFSDVVETEFGFHVIQRTQ